MTTSQLLRADLESVRAELNTALNRITDEMLDWAPAEGMRTIKGQIVEIVSTEQSLTHIGSGEDYEAPLNALNTVKKLRAALDSSRAETFALLDGLNKTALTAPVKVSPGFAKYLNLESVNMADVLRFLARHESYHSGQLYSYLWARGDNPYKW